MKVNFIDYLLTRPFILLIAVIISVCLESLVSFDQFMQRPFYADGVWLVSSAFHADYKWLIYTGTKVIIFIIAFAVLSVAVYTICNKRQLSMRAWIKPSLLVVVCIVLIPLLISSLKFYTGVYCPKNLIPYGGEYEHIGFFSKFLDCGCTSGGRCFPAGHASGGFALMALYFLPLKRKWRMKLLYAGLAFGWFMGLYQMARGEHFISHTLTTMFMALWMMSVLAKSFRKTIGVV